MGCSQSAFFRSMWPSCRADHGNGNVTCPISKSSMNVSWRPGPFRWCIGWRPRMHRKGWLAAKCLDPRREELVSRERSPSPTLNKESPQKLLGKHTVLQENNFFIWLSPSEWHLNRNRTPCSCPLGWHNAQTCMSLSHSLLPRKMGAGKHSEQPPLCPTCGLPTVCTHNC